MTNSPSVPAPLPGVLIGHETDSRRPTGVTVVLLPDGTTAGVDVRGAAPGTRETDLLDPVNTVQEVHAIALCGGSAFGLDAAGGVMRWLEGQGRGIDVGTVRVPLVPAAVVFDLGVGDPMIRPDADSGARACAAAVPLAAAAEGNVGAGAGASVGKLLGPDRAMRGGVGIATLTRTGGHDVGGCGGQRDGRCGGPRHRGAARRSARLTGLTRAERRGGRGPGRKVRRRPSGRCTTRPSGS